MAPIEFWFDFASTYSYLSALRIEEAAAGLQLVWKPFLLGPIFTELQQGRADSPFNLNPPRGRYMWRDLERESAKYKLPFRRPTVFPRNSVPAARVAVAASDEPWLPEFCKAVFRANFADDRDIADRAVLESLLQPAQAEFLTREKKGALRERTEQAKALHLFGAPNFLVNGEHYFGNDRLDDAIAFARNS